MAHLVNPFKNESIEGAITRLRAAHDYLVRAVGGCTRGSRSLATWGIDTKRQGVLLPGSGRPGDIGKDHEALSEIVNMVATIERLIAALEWFGGKAAFERALVAECHPTTSDNPKANDLVLVAASEQPLALVEVCDVVSTTGDGNKKEPSSLSKLCCTKSVPLDGPARFIATSTEFARYLTRTRRIRVHYRYERHDVGDPAGTVLLRLWPAS